MTDEPGGDPHDYRTPNGMARNVEVIKQTLTAIALILLVLMFLAIRYAFS